jgi:HlyD family secretion protein
MKTNKAKKIIFFTLTTLAFSALIYFTFSPKRVLVEMVQVQKGTFHSYFETDGVIRSKKIYTVPAFADGDIQRVDLRVGDLVKKGQTIVRLNWDVGYDPVRAPINGVISKIYRESAGPIRRGEPIVEIIDPKHLELMAELLTTDSTKLKIGDAFTISNWGSDFALHGKIKRVSQAGFIKVSALGVEEEKTEVTGEFNPEDRAHLQKLGNIFHVDVRFELGVLENVLMIPSGAIFRSGQDWAVYRVDSSNRARLVTIRISERNNEQIVVTHGLSEGERIVNFPGDLIRSGTKVK